MSFAILMESWTCKFWWFTNACSYWWPQVICTLHCTLALRSLSSMASFLSHCWAYICMMH